MDCYFIVSSLNERLKTRFKTTGVITENRDDSCLFCRRFEKATIKYVC